MSNVIDDPETTDTPENGDLDNEGKNSEQVGTSPAAGRGSQGAAEQDDFDDEETGERRQPERRDRRRQFSNARELMTEELRQRAEYSSERLKACLAGSIIVRLRDRSDKFLFDWTGSSPKAEVTTQTTGDCVIDLNENTLLKIASGDLNPQIGMLSEKIAVQGRLSLAVYFFNLIAPFPQQ